MLKFHFAPKLGKNLAFFSVLSLLLALFIHIPASAQLPAATPTSSKTPKICVVLSGGGARGFAHIGVLKQLEAMHIPIDCIAGTSMGAVIGGLYASGIPASEIEKRLEKLKLNDIALDRIDRRQLPQSIREEDEQYPLGATLGLSENGVRLPSGVVQASQFQELIQNWTSHLAPDIKFDQLPIPFRAVATDLETGEMVVFDKGALHKAIRASMAAPGVFAPTEIDGRLLSDGGLVRNLPIDIARDMGADVIIAVNIGTPLMPRKQLQTLFNVSQQMVNILTEQNVNAQKAKLKDNDILIEPNLGNIGFLDFGRSKEATEIGQEAARQLQTKLAGLALQDQAYRVAQNKRENPQLPPIQISFIDIDNNTAIPEADIRRLTGFEIGSFYNAEEVNAKLAALGTTREFDNLSHELVQKDNRYGIRIQANGKNWGPHFLRFGLALSSGFDGAGGYRLQIGHRRPWLTEGGLEWRNDVELGNTLKYRTELRQPLFEREGSYLLPFAQVSENTVNFYKDNVRLAEYSLRAQKAGVEVAYRLGNLGTLGEARLGLNYNRYSIIPKLGGVLTSNGVENTGSVDSLPSASIQQYGLKTGLVIDQLSDPSFPREGYKVDTGLFLGMDRSRDSYQEFNLDTVWAKSYGSHSLNLKFSAAGLFQKNDNKIRGIGSMLGGFQRLSAYQQDQFLGNYMLYGSATYLLRAVNFEMAGQSLFFGSSLEMGNVWNEKKDISVNSLRKSLSFFGGVNSFLGPVYLGFAIGQNGARSVFFQLGRQ
ncbi:patatin-like phospholipase family protein [Undibacterium crateris]|uniref:patatin-like phospholipase family protein n=1 Tax=Undibacterium crateris TaxID=2528175 RepID=UPI001389DB96|nr:patatin-like phospholipase family protein [Undibacterium crateris]NDI87527.1 patatin [Undibacterium crateris]